MGWNDVDKWSNLGGSNLGVTRCVLSLHLSLSLFTFDTCLLVPRASQAMYYDATGFQDYILIPHLGIPR